MIRASENIILPQTSLAGGKNIKCSKCQVCEQLLGYEELFLLITIYSVSYFILLRMCVSGECGSSARVSVQTAIGRSSSGGEKEISK